ncbi:alpha/beta fold hydrolase [Thalassobacillus hwangdonensis]|uniref:Alpha/beta fold hydrolase n=1 Tax=Thalassobacillus hwangdonensis TaxID=546108 RepID=A0ABW3L4D8_9BACI
MAYCKVKQAEIYYEDIGEGKPIVMIHGFSPDHRLMKGCMEPIFTERDGWRRIYIDLPGMGRTKNYQDINSSDDMLKAVCEFIQSVIPDEDYIIVGESYGGYITRGIIKKDAERVQGAAFICPVILPNPEDRTVGAHHILKKDEAFLSKLSNEEAEDFSNHQVVLDEYNWSRYKDEVLSGCMVVDEKVLLKVKERYAFSFDVDQEDFLKPSLFLMGRQDSIVGYKDALDVMEKYPRGTFATLDVAGHNLQIEQSDLFSHLVHEWLDRVEGEKN